MKVYKAIPGRFKELQRIYIRRNLPMYVLVVAFALGINMYTSKGEQNDATTLLIVAIVLFGFFAYVMLRNLKRLKAAYDSFALTISDVTIIRDEEGRQPLSLYHSEVTQIIKTKYGGFIIKGREPGDIIGVPAQIEDYEELEAALQKIMPISHNVKSNATLKTYLGTLISFGCMAGLVISTNKIVVAVCITIFTAFAGWGFYRIFSMKNADPKVKRSSLWILLVLAVMFWLAYTKLFIM